MLLSDIFIFTVMEDLFFLYNKALFLVSTWYYANMTINLFKNNSSVFWTGFLTVIDTILMLMPSLLKGKNTSIYFYNFLYMVTAFV